MSHQLTFRWYGVSSFHRTTALAASNISSASGMTSRCGWRTPSVLIQIRASPCSIHGTAKNASFFGVGWV